HRDRDRSGRARRRRPAGSTSAPDDRTRGLAAGRGRCRLSRRLARRTAAAVQRHLAGGVLVVATVAAPLRGGDAAETQERDRVRGVRPGIGTAAEAGESKRRAKVGEISGGEVIARMLQKEGVEKVFGIIDGTYFGFYSALHRLGIE